MHFTPDMLSSHEMYNQKANDVSQNFGTPPPQLMFIKFRISAEYYVSSGEI